MGPAGSSSSKRDRPRPTATHEALLSGAAQGKEARKTRRPAKRAQESGGPGRAAREGGPTKRPAQKVAPSKRPAHEPGAPTVRVVVSP
jgi:hypothetical protein